MTFVRSPRRGTEEAGVPAGTDGAARSAGSTRSAAGAARGVGHGRAVLRARAARGPSVVVRPRGLAAGLVCLLVALALGVVAIGSGEYPMSVGDVLNTLVGQGSPYDAFIVHELRLPRVTSALLVGAAFGLGGAVFQAVVRNPLGSPDILGFTQGSATGALVAIVLGSGSAAALAGGALLGGVVTGTLIYLLAWRQGVQSYRLVLVGVGMAAILTGVNGYLMTRGQITEAARATLWLTGSLNGRDWSDVLPLAGAMVVLVPLVLLACARPLRMMEMGDDAANAVGVRVESVRLTLLVSAVLLVALAAAAAGPVAFVALTAPQLARRLTASPGPNLLAAMCMGAALLIAADLVAQRAFAGHELPVGVVTGVLGGGYLVWLLARQRKAGRI